MGPVLTVVVEPVASQIPAPGLTVRAYQRRVSHRVQRSFRGGHADHGVSATLPSRPVDSPHMEAPCVSHPAPDAVCALSHRVTVERQLILLFDEDVERAVIWIPGVTELCLQSGTGHVQQEVQTGRFTEIWVSQLRVLPAVNQRPVGRGAAAVPTRVYRL